MEMRVVIHVQQIWETVPEELKPTQQKQKKKKKLELTENLLFNVICNDSRDKP